MRITLARIGNDTTPEVFTKAFGEKHKNYLFRNPFKTFKALERLKTGIKFKEKFDRFLGEYTNGLILDTGDKAKADLYFVYNVSPIDITVLLLRKTYQFNIDQEWVNRHLYALKRLYVHFDIIFAFPATKFSGNLAMKDDESYSLFLTFVQKYYTENFGYVPKDDKPAIIEIFGGSDEMMGLAGLYIADDGGFIAEKETIFNKECAELERQFPEIIT